jgi:hypothetical protein
MVQQRVRLVEGKSLDLCGLRRKFGSFGIFQFGFELEQRGLLAKGGGAGLRRVDRIKSGPQADSLPRKWVRLWGVSYWISADCSERMGLFSGFQFGFDWQSSAGRSPIPDIAR